MSVTTTVTCNACDKDVTKGNGVAWHLTLHAVPVAMRPGTVPRHDAGMILPTHHFCNEACLASWAAKAAAKKEADQLTFEKDAQQEQ